MEEVCIRKRKQYLNPMLLASDDHIFAYGRGDDWETMQKCLAGLKDCVEKGKGKVYGSPGKIPSLCLTTHSM